MRQIGGWTVHLSLLEQKIIKVYVIFQNRSFPKYVPCVIFLFQKIRTHAFTKQNKTKQKEHMFSIPISEKKIAQNINVF
jgi:hypothetical protein